MDEESTSQFWFEPGGFRRHGHATVGDGEKFFHRGRMHGKGDTCSTSLLGEFIKASDASDELDSAVGAWVVCCSICHTLRLCFSVKP